MEKPSKYTYPALFIPEAVGGYSVRFPQLDGCFTQGDSFEEAWAMAAEAASLYLYTLEEDGDPIPTPSDIKDVKAPDGAIVTLVRADTEAYAKMMAEERASGQSEAETAASELAEKTA